MSEQQVLNCSLSIKEQQARRSLVRASVSAHVTAVTSIPNGLRVEFDTSVRLQELVNEFVIMEQECCSFLTLTLSQPADQLSLLIEGPEGAADVIEMFHNALQGGQGHDSE